MVKDFHCIIQESWFYLWPAPETWWHSSAKQLFRLHVTPCLTSLESETGKWKKKGGKKENQASFFPLLPRKFPEKTHLLNLVFRSYRNWWCHKLNTTCMQTGVDVQILHKSKTISVLHWIGKCFSQILWSIFTSQYNNYNSSLYQALSSSSQKDLMLTTQLYQPTALVIKILTIQNIWAVLSSHQKLFSPVPETPEHNHYRNKGFILQFESK